MVDNQRVNDLPSNGRNPFQFVGLATGVQFAGSTQTYFRPFDTQLDFTINGGQRGVNEIQIDGVPDNAITYYTAQPQFAYAPPSEATQEFKVQTNTYDAQYGRTSGGVINLSIKSGTNRPHGAVYEYLRRTDLTANTYANNANNQVRPNRLQDQYGFELDGPVFLPKVYKGNHVNHPKFRLVRAKTIRVETMRPARVQLDGELYGDSPVTFSVLPGAIELAG